MKTTIVKEKMTKQELVKLLVENFTNEGGVLDLSGLDFTEFNCNVDISSMNVAGNLYQDNQKVQEYLFQSNQEVQGNLWQNEQSVQGDLIQDKANETKQVDNLNECISNSINLPPHYNIAGIDTIDLILKICEHNNTGVREGFYLANTLKYLIRYNNKNGVDDLNKAKDYLNRLIDQVTKEENFYNVDGQGD